VPPVGRAQHHVEQRVARLVRGHLLAQQARDVDVDVLAHGAQGARVRAELDHRQDRVADDVALPGREEVHRVPGGGAQRDHLGRGRRRVHEPETGTGRRLGLVEHAVDQALLADLLDVAERLLLDGGQATLDVALGRLRLGEVAGLEAVDQRLVAVEHEHEALAHLVIAAARRDQVLAAGDLGGLAEQQRVAGRVELVEGVADRRVGAAARGGVRLTALGRNPQLGDRGLLAAQLGGPVHVLLGRLRGAHDGVVVTVLLDAEAGDRLAGQRDAVDHLLRPALLDADDHDGGNVRVGAGPDQGAEMEIEVLAELQAPVGVRQCERALDVVGDRLGGRVGDVVDRQDDDVVADTDATVLAPVTPECCVAEFQ
jgi:hypothetical protein